MESNFNPGPPPQPAAGKGNRNVIIGVVIAVVLCCCLVVTGVGGYYGYKAYVAAQQMVEDVQNFEMPTDIPFVDPNGNPVVPDFSASGDVPEGGLADEQTRIFAWASVQLVSMLSGCTTPTVEGTTIAVLDQPSNGGSWREEWNVNCGDGTFKAFPLTFTPENGMVNVSVDFQP
ncbi:hypothetical protein MASR2M66_00200 [Chloroflexota bacterium]